MDERASHVRVWLPARQLVTANTLTLNHSMYRIQRCPHVVQCSVTQSLTSALLRLHCAVVRFLPHSSADYIPLYSSASLPDPTKPLPAHDAVSELFVQYIDCLHYRTHHTLLVLELSFASLTGLLFVAALVRRYFRLRAGNFSLKDMLLPSPPDSSPASSLLSSSQSSFATFFLSLFLCMCSFVALLLGSQLDWTLLYWSSPLLLAYMFVTFFASLFFLLATKQYCLLLLRSFPLSSPHAPSLLSSSVFSRLYCALLTMFCCVFVVSFLFLLLFVAMSSKVLRARFLVTTVVFSSVSLSVTLSLLVVQLQLVRRHIRELSLPYMSSQLLPLLPQMPPLTTASSSASNSSPTSFTTSSSSLTSTASEAIGGDASATYAFLRAHSSHCRNSQYWLAVHALFYLFLSAFIVLSRPHYHLMHGLLLNTLMTVVALTYLCTVSLPVPRPGGEGKVQWGMSTGSVGDVRSGGHLASLRSISEEVESDEYSRSSRHVYPL